MGAMTGRFQCLLWVALAMACATLQGLPQNAAEAHLPEGFPYSAWLEQKEITQIGWSVVVGKPALRSDLRQEIEIWAMIARQDARKTEDHDLVMYARVLDGGRALGPVHMVEPVENRVPPEFQPKGPPPPPGFRIIALVKPGKYRLELALLDRTNGRYSTKFESVVVEGLKTDALAKSFEKFSKFEFVPLRKREDTAIGLPPGPDFSFGPGGFSGTLYVRRKNFVGLPASSSGVTEDLPTFVIQKPGMHLSIIAMLTPPDGVVGDEGLTQYFQDSLVNLLSAVTRLRVQDGTTQFTGIDLLEGKRIFDHQDVEQVTLDSLNAAIRKDLSTISLSSMTGRASNERFITDLFKEEFDRAEQDGAEHVIVFIGHRTGFRDNSGVPLPANGCRCKVHYLRVFSTGGRDDIEKLLRNYKPLIYEPFNWRDFREHFARIYERLQLQN